MICLIFYLLFPLFFVYVTTEVNPNYSLRPPRLHDSGRIQYKTNWACEGNTLTLECDPGQLIHLVRANYGRFSLSICNDGGQTDLSVNCMSYKSFLIMQDRCSQNSNCSVVVTSKLFGDPCTGTSKYLEVQYHCVAASAGGGGSTTRRPGDFMDIINSVPEAMDDLQGVRPPYESQPMINLTSSTLSSVSTPSPSTTQRSVRPTTSRSLPISTRVPPAINFTPPGVDPIEALFRPPEPKKKDQRPSAPMIDSLNPRIPPVDVTRATVAPPSPRRPNQRLPVGPDGPPEWLFQSSSVSSNSGTRGGSGISGSRSRSEGPMGDPRVMNPSSSRGGGLGVDRDHDLDANNANGRNHHGNYGQTRDGNHHHQRPSLTPTLDGSSEVMNAQEEDDDMILMAVALFFIVFFLVMGTFALIFCLYKHSHANRNSKYMRRLPFVNCLFGHDRTVVTCDPSGSSSSEKSSASSGSTGSVLINQSSSAYGSSSMAFPIVATRIPTQIPSDTIKSTSNCTITTYGYGHHVPGHSVITSPNSTPGHHQNLINQSPFYHRASNWPEKKSSSFITQSLRFIGHNKSKFDNSSNSNNLSGAATVTSSGAATTMTGHVNNSSTFADSGRNMATGPIVVNAMMDDMSPSRDFELSPTMMMLMDQPSLASASAALVNVINSSSLNLVNQPSNGPHAANSSMSTSDYESKMLINSLYRKGSSRRRRLIQNPWESSGVNFESLNPRYASRAELYSSGRLTSGAHRQNRSNSSSSNVNSEHVYECIDADSINVDTHLRHDSRTLNV